MPKAWHWRDEVPVLHLEAGRGLRDRVPPAVSRCIGDSMAGSRFGNRAAITEPFGMWAVQLQCGRAEPRITS